MICHKLEAVVQSCSVKKVFLEISQNSKENTVNFVKFQRTPFQIEHLWWLFLINISYELWYLLACNLDVIEKTGIS